MDSVSGKTYAVIDLHNMRLSLPQDEIVNLDVASAVSFGTAADDGSVGALDFQGQSLPVFSLSEELDVIDERPQDQNICVSVAVAGVPAFSLTCAALKPLQLDMTTMSPMPDPMADEMGPLQGLVVSDDSILFISSAQALQNHIQRSGGHNG